MIPPADVEFQEKSPLWKQGEIIKQRLIEELHKKQKITVVSLYYDGGKPFSLLVVGTAVAKLCELGFGVKVLGRPGDPGYSLEITRP